tara:strand:- start:711 stop:899 length:189 start_codon:yes stop_codon:yes gene_type:complete
MNDIDLAGKIKRVIEDRRELIIGTLMDGLLKDMEHYKSLQGELVALNLIESEISQHFKDSNA